MLKGRRVVLRRVEPEDYPHILRWQNDPVVFRWMDYARPFSADDIRDSEQRATVEGHPFVIEADGKPLGRIGLNNFRPRDRMASLYIFIGERDAWGNGYGRDALMTLLAYAFDTCNLRMVELWTLADNERAIRLYKACGFVEEARLRDRSWIEGEYIAHLVMSITAEEYARTRADYGLQTAVSVGQIIESYLADRDVRFERLSDVDWALQLRGEKKFSITVLLAQRERTVQIESFFIRRAAENHADFYRMFLRANMRIYGVRFAIDDIGDVFLVGRVPVDAVNEDELDRLLGAILTTSDEMFMPAIEVGFASYLARDMAWRAAQKFAEPTVRK